MCLQIRSIFFLALGYVLGLQLYLFLPDFPDLWGPQIIKLNKTLVKAYRNHSEPGDTTVAEFMAEKVRVFCVILVGEVHLEERALAIRDTWAKRCNSFQFFSTVDYDEDDLQAIKVSDAYHSNLGLWDITRNSLRHVYDYHLEDFDWFLVATHRTFVVVENLRRVLLYKDVKKPIFTGVYARKNKKQKQFTVDTNSGVALSRTALKNIVEDGLSSRDGPCFPDSNYWALFAFENCLSSSGVKFFKVDDKEKKNRILPADPSFHYRQANFSSSAVSFYAANTYSHYRLEYLIYHVSVFGGSGIDRIPKDK